MKTSIHISENDYREIKEFINSLEDEFNGIWEGDNLSVSINAKGHFETVYTGVEHMGYRESYREFILDSVSIDDFWAYDEDGDVLPCDFDEKKITF